MKKSSVARLSRFAIRRFDPFHSPELQVKVLDECFQLLVILWRDVSCGLQEVYAVFLDRFPGRVQLVADEPVGDIDVRLQVFSRGVLVQDGADGDAELGVSGQLCGPVLESVNVGEGYDLTSLQYQQSVIDARLSASG